MNRLFLWLVIAVPAATFSCKTANNSSVKDVGVVNTPAADMRFITVQGRSFAMQETETTRAQWKAVMGKYPEELPGWYDCYLKERTVFDAFHPVTCVSGNDANDFARKMNDKHDGYNYRLPTEEEWNYAAGNIEGPTFGWCDTGWTKPVGKLKANNGLYDMVGNVWEWTSTPYDSSGYYLVIRGDRFGNYYPNCRSAARSHNEPDYRSTGLGFRLVRTSSP